MTRSSVHPFSVEPLQEYGPDWPVLHPEQVGWGNVKPLGEFLKESNDQTQPLAGRIIEELAKYVEDYIGQPAYVERLSEEACELREWIAFAQFLKSERILSSLQCRPNPTDIPQLIRFTAYTEKAGPVPTDGHQIRGSYAHGASLHPIRALAKTLGECAERYSQTRYQARDFVGARYKEVVGRGAIDPQRWSGFSEDERKIRLNRAINDRSMFAWTEAINFMTGQRVLVPAQLVYTNYKFVQNETVIRQPISTGSAGGATFEAAMCSGLCEAIERDAFMVAYINKLSLPRVDLSSITEPSIRFLADSFARYRLRLEVLDMTTDIRIPSILAFVVDETSDRGPALSVGAKVDTDPLRAIWGAIEEVWHTFCGGRIQCESEEGRKLIFREWKDTDIIAPHNHLEYWARPEMRRHIQFFLRGPLRKYRGSQKFRPRNFANQLRQVTGALNRAGMHDILFVNLTIPPLSRQGYKVVMTLVPELTHMYLNENMRATGGARLRTVPAKMGYQARHPFNQVPHPFA